MGHTAQMLLGVALAPVVLVVWVIVMFLFLTRVVEPLEQRLAGRRPFKRVQDSRVGRVLHAVAWDE